MSTCVLVTCSIPHLGQPVSEHCHQSTGGWPVHRLEFGSAICATLGRLYCAGILYSDKFSRSRIFTDVA